MTRSLLPIRIFRVAERSMEPSIAQGDYVVANCWFLSLSAGDVVVAQGPDGMVLVKRVKKVGSRGVYVIGDNAKLSVDSRRFGWIGRERVIGKVIATA